jgi:hypothetical protein
MSDARFLRSEEEMVGDTWEKKVAIKYYDKLFKEYCLADLSRHKVPVQDCMRAVPVQDCVRTFSMTPVSRRAR